ncbi:hypothetical protein PCAR4_830104 [Paraburkholderia caribensis]|nr:hypothetical protein PCAR4_830104 [Paraburkholderia caribensis]
MRWWRRHLDIKNATWALNGIGTPTLKGIPVPEWRRCLERCVELGACIMKIAILGST